MASHSQPFSFPPMLLSYMVIILFILLNVTPYVDSSDYFSSCANKFSCGNLRNVSFPFWGDGRPEGCGHPGFFLECDSNMSYITINNIKYFVKEVQPEKYTLKIARFDYLKGLCPSQFQSTSLDHNLFNYVPVYRNLTLYYGCNFSVASNWKGYFDCPVNGVAGRYAYPQLGAYGPATGWCTISVVVPILSTFTVLDIENATGEVVREGFEVQWIVGIEECDKCHITGGVCGYDYKLNQTACYCKGSDSGSRSCPLLPDTDAKAPQVEGSSSGKLNGRIIIAIGLSAGGTGIVIISAVIICNRKKCFRKIIKKKGKFHDHNVEKLMECYGSLVPRRYTYSEVKRMTNLFANKLGQGGYGTVYKASLPPDGHLVAVKLVSESKGNGEEFINEVASISRTSHVNIVSLLGFCYEWNKRALIYEFMPNGSLDKFIYKRGSPNAICSLEWKTMFQIAIGIARGLEYLHRGCNTRILHLDIKPQNILLDKDFCPKISDFGLAKICQKKESIVSIKGTRGTIGFIAPEVFSRTFGGVSHKSDVYSYDMLVLEMVGGRKNFDNGGSHTSEMYFPDWIYKDLEQGNILSRNMSITDEENEILRKMTLVSLWCIQTNPLDRPSMSKVEEMLQGPLESLPFPPKPFLHSPPKSPLQCSDGSSTNMQDTNSRSTQDGSQE